MTSKATTLTQERGEQERFPEYPPRDDMQNWLYLYETAVVTTLAIHYAGEPNVTVASEVPLGPSSACARMTRAYRTCYGHKRRLTASLMEEQTRLCDRPTGQGS